MEPEKGNESVVLPHHEQQALCTTRLPYRQGRKLTAVKVYTIFNESNHLLVFGVPSLNLRQEAKGLFSKFGKLVQFTVSKNHPAEPFTETFHAAFERIQSARLAKKMLDTKNFYGGSLHVCYAPEFENIGETRSKLLQRQKDVLYRLSNLQKEPIVKEKSEENPISEVNVESESKKLNMGELNTIGFANNVNSKKRKKDNEHVTIEKKFKPCFVSNEDVDRNKTNSNPNICDIVIGVTKNPMEGSSNTCDSNLNRNDSRQDDSNIEIIDCTSAEQETVTNINESLNYDKFGNEVVRKIPQKPVNRIKFHLGNKSLT